MRDARDTAIGTIALHFMLKGIILWKYERASWQWDLLCCLIMMFIFLTPKTWFDRKEKLAAENVSVVVKDRKIKHGEILTAR